VVLTFGLATVSLAASRFAGLFTAEVLGADFFLDEDAFDLPELFVAGARLDTALDIKFLDAFDLVAAFLGALPFARLFLFTAFFAEAARLAALFGRTADPALAGLFLTTFFLVGFAARRDFLAAPLFFFFAFFDAMPAPH
jgi:hypothetical protein